MKREKRRQLLPVSLLIGLIVLPGCAQTYQPTRPIELVVHSAPGGGSDVFAREVVAMVEKEKLLAQPIRVVNKIVDAGLEAMEYLVDKKGDDHTIAVFTNTWVATPLTSAKAKYSVKDLTPIVRLVLEPTIAVVNAKSPYKSMNDFVAAAKKDPNRSESKPADRSPPIESLTGLLTAKRHRRQMDFRPHAGRSKTGIANLLSRRRADHHSRSPRRERTYRQRQSETDRRTDEKRLTGFAPGADDQRARHQRADHRQCARHSRAARRVQRSYRLLGGLLRAPDSDLQAGRNTSPTIRSKDVFIKGGELGPFLDEQTKLMRSVLQQAGVKLAR
jgi:hypothetical protein